MGRAGVADFESNLDEPARRFPDHLLRADDSLARYESKGVIPVVSSKTWEKCEELSFTNALQSHRIPLNLTASCWATFKHSTNEISTPDVVVILSSRAFGRGLEFSTVS
jgi:hypothetical protein